MWLIGAVAVMMVLLAVGAVAVQIGSSRQRRALDDDIRRLRRAGIGADAAARSLDWPPGDLPAPVARYLRMALPRPASIGEVRMTQSGTLRTDVASERWMPFEAEQIIVPPATGFVWNARVHVAPLVHVRVRDALIQGLGSGQVSLLSAFTVSADAGTPEMNAGSLHRYLAEAVWYPTALLPRPALRWAAIDDTRALATLTAHGVTVSLEFRFAETGEVIGIYTPGRWGKFSDGYRQAGWEGHFRDYRERGGVVVPSEGDVGWYVEDELRVVWKGRVIAYDVRAGV